MTSGSKEVVDPRGSLSPQIRGKVPVEANRQVVDEFSARTGGNTTLRKPYTRSVGPGAPVGAQATEKSTAQRAVQGTPIVRSAYKKRSYQNKDTKLEPKQDKRSHRDITKTQRVLLDKIGTIVSESGTNSPVAHQNSRGR